MRKGVPLGLLLGPVIAVLVLLSTGVVGLAGLQAAGRVAAQGALPPDVLEQSTGELLRVMGVVWGVGTLASLIVGWGLARGLGVALDEVEADIETLGLLDLDAAPHGAGARVSEVGRLHAALSGARDRLRSAARYLPGAVLAEVSAAGGTPGDGLGEAEVSVLFLRLDSGAGGGESLDAVAEAIAAHQGLRVALWPHGLTAIWGAPRTRAEHAVLACRAAMAARLAAEGAQVGVSSGHSTVGHLGVGDEVVYGPTGPVRDLAANLVRLNSTYGTRCLVGEATARLAKASFVGRRVDRLRHQGQPVDAWELFGTHEDVEDRVLSAIDRYHAALALYLEGNFAEAEAGFEVSDAAFPKADGPSRLLAARCRWLAENPPGQGWDGVFEPPVR